MYIRNSMGPSTVHWGTPEVTAIFSDVVFSKSTVCVVCKKRCYPICYLVRYTIKFIIIKSV